jgi:hypothetical protein
MMLSQGVVSFLSVVADHHQASYLALEMFIRSFLGLKRRMTMLQRTLNDLDLIRLVMQQLQNSREREQRARLYRIYQVLQLKLSLNNFSLKNSKFSTIKKKIKTKRNQRKKKNHQPLIRRNLTRSKVKLI